MPEYCVGYITDSGVAGLLPATFDTLEQARLWMNDRLDDFGRRGLILQVQKLDKVAIDQGGPDPECSTAQSLMEGLVALRHQMDWLKEYARYCPRTIQPYVWHWISELQTKNVYLSNALNDILVHQTKGARPG